MNDFQRSFLSVAEQDAIKASHVFPRMAACEAALESSWGNSVLARDDNNLFGTKVHRHSIYGTAYLPTREFQNGEWVVISAGFTKYPDWATSFIDRMVTLNRLASVYPNYAAALEAKTPEEYIAAVSKTWSTDPNRGSKVLDVYNEYQTYLEETKQ